MTYYYKKHVSLSFQEALEKTKQSLAAQGFGVLTEIDVRATLKTKLNVDYDDYTIIGACNPPLAYGALQAEKTIGLLLPCNLIVYADKGNVSVAAILPTVAMEKTGNQDLLPIAAQVESKLKKVVDAVGQNISMQ